MSQHIEVLATFEKENLPHLVAKHYQQLIQRERATRKAWSDIQLLIVEKRAHYAEYIDHDEEYEEHQEQHPWTEQDFGFAGEEA